MSHPPWDGVLSQGCCAELSEGCVYLQVYLASASPPVRFPNVYGVDMPVRKEFVAFDKTEEEICEELGADALIYQSIEDLVAVGHELNPSITEFDTSCFTGGFVMAQHRPPPAEHVWPEGIDVGTEEKHCWVGMHWLQRCKLLLSFESVVY